MLTNILSSMGDVMTVEEILLKGVCTKIYECKKCGTTVCHYHDTKLSIKNKLCTKCREEEDEKCNNS